jgi:hypothetical protein
VFASSPTHLAQVTMMFTESAIQSQLDRKMQLFAPTDFPSLSVSKLLKWAILGGFVLGLSLATLMMFSH